MHNTHTIWPPLLLRTGKCLGPRGGAFKSVEEKNKKTLGTKSKTACTILLGCFSECCVLSWRRRIWRHFQFGKVPFLLVRLCREEPFKTLLLMSSTWRHRHPHLSIKIWNPLLVFFFFSFSAPYRVEKIFFSSSSSGTARSLHPVMGVCGTCSCAIYSILLSHCWFSTFSFNRND